MPNSEPLISAAEEINKSLEELLARARVKNAEGARVAACLCLTIAELYVAVIAVLRSRAPSHAPVLIRSMHEAHADLKNLVADDSYLNQMRFDNADQVLKTCEGFLQDPDLKDMEEVRKNMGKWQTIERGIYDDLYAKGFRPSKQWLKFKKAGMAEEYATAYRFLCSFTHSDLNTLTARHAGQDHLRFTAPLPPETLQSVLGLATSIYVSTIDTLPVYTQLTDEEVKSANEAADAIWQKAQT